MAKEPTPEEVLKELVKRVTDLEDKSKTLDWTMYQSLTDQIKHFNSLQGTYRSFASAWILAAFAGIASTTTRPDVAQWICMLSIGGMLMFLTLDIGYHTLLRAVLGVQKTMEEKNGNSWIPKAAGAMTSAFKIKFADLIWVYYLLAIGIFLIAFFNIKSA